MENSSIASQLSPSVNEISVPMKTMTNYLIRIGADKIPHTRKTYLGHAIGTYRDMKSWGASDALCCAAMFHSIYGTEGFQDFTLPLAQRDELRALIGEYAELLAYANCAMDRASFHALVDADLHELSFVRLDQIEKASNYGAGDVRLEMTLLGRRPVDRVRIALGGVCSQGFRPGSALVITHNGSGPWKTARHRYL